MVKAQSKEVPKPQAESKEVQRLKLKAESKEAQRGEGESSKENMM